MRWIELGRIGAPWGVRGWVRIESWTDPPLQVLEYQPWALRLASGERIEGAVAEVQEQGERIIARLEGVEERDAAARLTGAVIVIEREALPPTAPREWYRADLIGLEVRNLEDAVLGRIERFVDAPTGPVMVVRDREREHWVLAVPQFLRQVDLAAGRVRVDWPAESG